MRLKLTPAAFRKLVADLRALDIERTAIGVIAGRHLASPGLTALMLIETLVTKVAALERRVQQLEYRR